MLYEKRVVGSVQKSPPGLHDQFVEGKYMAETVTIQAKRWRDFYNDALHESGDPAVRQFKVELAISVCLYRQIETATEGSSDRQEILIALDDLKILRGLYKKHGGIGKARKNLDKLD